MHGNRSTPTGSDWLALAGFACACFAVAALGGLATASALEAWYPSLAKPDWTPPNAVFGPVWTALYLAMAVAAWRVWRAGGWVGARGALAAFGIQLALNLAWSLGFFGLRSPGLGVLIIVPLWVAIYVTLRRFQRIDPVAGWLMAPYLAWVTFAAALNATVWWLNR
jgi:tryptophan-rich sensory protein